MSKSRFLRASRASGSTRARVERMVRQGSRRVRRALSPWQRRELERGDHAN
jgi:hypothetical protein